MSTVHVPGVGRQGGTGFSEDVGEIVSVPQQEPITSVSRAQLLPGEEAASLRPLNAKLPSQIASLTRFLGPHLTVANPAWCGDPVPRMRALQKRLVEHSLTLPGSERAPCMRAISVVEKAVQLRLRYQQMYMNEFEMTTEPESVKAE